MKPTPATTGSKPVAANPLDAELLALDRRQASLKVRAASAGAEHAAAAAKRRDLLVESDDPDPKALSEADRVCREAEDRRAAAADALIELGKRADDLRARIGRQRVNEGRKREATELEASAKAVDAIMTRAGALAAEIEKVRTDLAAAISTRAATCYDPPIRLMPGVGNVYLTLLQYDHEMRSTKEVIPPATVAERLIGHVLAPVLPGLGITDQRHALRQHMQDQVTPILGPVDSEDAGKMLITDRMRELAESVRRGTDTAEPKASDIIVGERTIFVTEPCFYKNGKDLPTILHAWTQTVPIPVADRLMELGIAISATSAEAEELIAAKTERDHGSSALNVVTPLAQEQCRDIRFDISSWRAEELERRRAAWRAAQPS